MLKILAFYYTAVTFYTTLTIAAILASNDLRIPILAEVLIMAVIVATMILALVLPKRTSTIAFLAIVYTLILGGLTW